MFRGDLVVFQNTLALTILTNGGSYHFPMKLEIGEELKPLSLPFKFERIWLQDNGFLDMVEKWWKETHVEEFTIFSFTSKLKIIKQKIYNGIGNILRTYFKKKIGLRQR